MKKIILIISDPPASGSQASPGPVVTNSPDGPHANRPGRAPKQTSGSPSSPPTFYQGIN